MRLIAKSLKTQSLHSPFAENIYHFWRLSKKYPHLFFHPLENQGKWEENAWSYDVADCIDKLKTGPQQSLRPKKSKSKKLLTSQIEAKKIWHNGKNIRKDRRWRLALLQHSKPAIIRSDKKKMTAKHLLLHGVGPAWWRLFHTPTSWCIISRPTPIFTIYDF